MISPPRSLYFPDGTGEREREREREALRREEMIPIWKHIETDCVTSTFSL